MTTDDETVRAAARAPSRDERAVLVTGRSLLCGVGVGAASAVAAVAALTVPLAGAGFDDVVGLGSLAVLVGLVAGFVVQLLNVPVFLAAVRCRRRGGSLRWWGAVLPLAAAAGLPLLLLGDADVATSLLSAAASLVTVALLVRPVARWCARPLVAHA